MIRRNKRISDFERGYRQGRKDALKESAYDSGNLLSTLDELKDLAGDGYRMQSHWNSSFSNMTDDEEDELIAMVKTAIDLISEVRESISDLKKEYGDSALSKIDSEFTSVSLFAQGVYRNLIGLDYGTSLEKVELEILFDHILYCVRFIKKFLDKQM